MAKITERQSGLLGVIIGLLSIYMGIQVFINATHTVNQTRITLMAGIMSILFGAWKIWSCIKTVDYCTQRTQSWV